MVHAGANADTPNVPLHGQGASCSGSDALICSYPSNARCTSDSAGVPPRVERWYEFGGKDESRINIDPMRGRSCEDSSSRFPPCQEWQAGKLDYSSDSWTRMVMITIFSSSSCCWTLRQYLPCSAQPVIASKMIVYIILALIVRSQQGYLSSIFGNASHWSSADVGCIKWINCLQRMLAPPALTT